MKNDAADENLVWTCAVVEARYSLSAPEQRLILRLLEHIEGDGDAFKGITFGVREMEEVFGGNIPGERGETLYGQFEVVCARLQSRTFDVQFVQSGKWSLINWAFPE